MAARRGYTAGACSLGAVFGTGMGAIIHYFKFQPFIVTLAECSGAGAYAMSSVSIPLPLTNPFYTPVAQAKSPCQGAASVPINVIIALVNCTARESTRPIIPGSGGATCMPSGETSNRRLLMGLPVASTKVLVYTFSGLCSALAGVVFTFYMLSGYGLRRRLELDTIAAVVIGGTLLTGGVGYVPGTFFGVLIQGRFRR